MGQAQDVAGLNTVHEEWHAQSVALGEEIRTVIDVCGDVVGTLGAENRQ